MDGLASLTLHRDTSILAFSGWPTEGGCSGNGLRMPPRYTSWATLTVGKNARITVCGAWKVRRATGKSCCLRTRFTTATCISSAWSGREALANAFRLGVGVWCKTRRRRSFRLRFGIRRRNTSSASTIFYLTLRRCSSTSAILAWPRRKRRPEPTRNFVSKCCRAWPATGITPSRSWPSKSTRITAPLAIM